MESVVDHDSAVDIGRTLLLSNTTAADVLSILFNVTVAITVIGLLVSLLLAVFGFLPLKPPTRRQDSLLGWPLVGNLLPFANGLASSVPGLGPVVTSKHLTSLSDVKVLEALYNLEITFGRVSLLNEQCRLAVICQTHTDAQATKFGNMAPVLKQTLGLIDSETIATASPRFSSKIAYMKQFADIGSNTQNCIDERATCDEITIDKVARQARYSF